SSRYGGRTNVSAGCGGWARLISDALLARIIEIAPLSRPFGTIPFACRLPGPDGSLHDGNARNGQNPGPGVVARFLRGDRANLAPLLGGGATFPSEASRGGWATHRHAEDGALFPWPGRIPEVQHVPLDVGILQGALGMESWLLSLVWPLLPRQPRALR